MAQEFLSGVNITAGDLTVDTNTLYVDSSNNRVGIGTASPSYNLHNTGTSRLEGRITLGGNVNNFIEGSGSAITFKSNNHYIFTKGANTLVTIKDTGNVGIGTTSPDTLLHLASSTGPRLTLEDTDTSIGVDSIIADISFVGGEIGGETARIGAVSETTGGEAGLRFYTGSSVAERLRITKDGDVGIGTTSPGEKLDVNGNILADALGIGNDQIYSGSVNINNSGSYRIGNTELVAKSGSSLSLYQGKLIVENGGNVGIGTTSPDSMLEISSSSATDFLKLTSTSSSANPVKLIFEKGSSEQGIIEYNRNGDLEIYNTDGDGGVMIDGSASAGGDLYVANSGYVGIGTTSPSEPLDVVGTARMDNAIVEGTLYAGDSVQHWGDGGTGMFFGTDVVSFKTASTERARFKSNGYFGIGTTNPDEKLHVMYAHADGTATTYAKAIIEDTDAQLDLLSTNDGTWGSSINLVEAAGSGANTDVWAMARKTTGGVGDSSLNFNFGTNNQHNNTTRVSFSSAGNITAAGTIASPRLTIKEVASNAQIESNTSSLFLKAGNVQIQGNLIPDADSTRNLGATNRYWANGYIDAITTTGNVIVGGDLTVNGTTTTVNSTNLDLSDNIIGLNRGASSNTNDSGLLIERGSTGDNAAFLWDESVGYFSFGTTQETASSTGSIVNESDWSWKPIKAGGAVFTDNVSTSSNAKVISSRKFTARDGNGVMLTADDASSGLSIADNGNATFTGGVTFSSFTLDGNTISGIDDSGEFTDNDSHIMTSAAVRDKFGFAYFASSSGDYDDFTRGLQRGHGGSNGPSGTTHATGFTLLQDDNNYGFQLFSTGSSDNSEGLKYRYKGTSYGNWQTIVTKTYSDGRYLKLSGGSMTGAITMVDSNVISGSGDVKIYARSTDTGASFIQFQNTSTGSSNSDGLTVGVNSTNAYIWNREASNLYLGTNDTAAVTINSSQNATFAGTLTVEGADAITIPDYILHAGDDSKFGFPSNDNFKIRLAGSDLFNMSTTSADFAGDITLGGSLIGDANWDIYAEYTNRGRINLLSSNSTNTSTQIALLTDGNQRLTIDKGGTSTVKGNLVVEGVDVTITSNIIHAGDSNTYFGFQNNDEYRIVVGGSEKFHVNTSRIRVNDDIHVAADSTYDIGTSSARHANIYADAFHGDGSNLTNVTASAPSNMVSTDGNNQTISGSKIFTHADGIKIMSGTQTNAIRLYTENDGSQIADSFSANTAKSYIYFDARSGSNDPGYIMHETSSSETNEGVLHLVPSDDNSTGDYVSIHGTNDPDVLKLHTSGLIETVNLQLQLKSGLNELYLNDNVIVSGTTNLQKNVTVGGTSGETSTNAFIVNRGSDGSTAFRIQNSGEVVTQNNYFYAAGSGVSMYVQNTAVFRGSIINDGSGAPVTVGDDLKVTGTLFIASKLEHTSDSDTFLNFSDNTITLDAGGISATFSGNGNASFEYNLMPAAENAYNIGSASLRWEDLYVDDGYIRNGYIDEYIYHNGDTDTYIRFTDNTLTFRTAGDDGLIIDSNRNATFSGHVVIASSKYLEFSAMGKLINMDVSSWSSGQDEHNILYSGWTSSTGDYLSLKVAGNSASGHGNLIIGDNGLWYGKMDTEDTAQATDSATNPNGATNRFRVDNSGNGTFAGAVNTGGNITASTSGNTFVSSVSTDTWAGMKIQASNTASSYLFFYDTAGERARVQSTANNDLKFLTNGGGSLVLTLDSSQNATFEGNISVSGTVDGVDISGLPSFTTVGTNFAQLGNVSVASYVRINADESLSYLNASQFLSAIGGISNITINSQTGLTGGGTGTSFNLNLDLNELTTTTGSGNADFFAVVNSGGTQYKIAPGNINNSTFNNDAGYLTSSSTQSKYVRSDADDTMEGILNIDGDGHWLKIQGNMQGNGAGTSQGLALGWNRSNGGRESEIIFHGGTSTHGDGELKVTSYNGSTYETAAIFQGDGGVSLFFNNSQKFITTGDGAAITGHLSATTKLSCNFTSGSSGLQIEAGTTSVSTMRVDADRFRIWMGNGSNETFTVAESGRVGINDSSPDYTLDVDGNVSNTSIYASHDIVAYSDIRVKDEIETIPDALEKVNNLRGVTFVRTDSTSDKRMMGVIAQEVEKIIPEVVTTKESDGHKAVAYGNMVGVLIEAVKELNEKVRILEEKLNTK